MVVQIKSIQIVGEVYAIFNIIFISVDSIFFFLSNIITKKIITHDTLKAKWPVWKTTTFPLFQTRN